jgi:hypothetical protein
LHRIALPAESKGLWDFSELAGFQTFRVAGGQDDPDA